MKTINTRAPEMWELIQAAGIQPRGKTVIDLGCGHADLLLYMHLAGADTVLGVDQDQNLLIDNLNRFQYAWSMHEITELNAETALLQRGLFRFNHSTIERFIDTHAAGPLFGPPHPWDIGLCCSVLPYTDRHDDILNWLAKWARQVIIEWQYAGDGPGRLLKGDNDAQLYLMRVFSSVENIGRTFVEGRETYRTLWLCQGKRERRAAKR